jgi:hypothetical protein
MGNAPEQPDAPERFAPVALLLAWLVPGAGHAYLGQFRRGLYIFAGVTGLFVSGLLVAGPSAVDSGMVYQEWIRARRAQLSGQPTPPRNRCEGGEPVWFAGQALAGPLVLIVDCWHQFHLKIREPGTRRVRDEAGQPQTEVFTTFRPPRPDEARDPQTGGVLPFAPTQAPPYVRALGRVQEIGMLSCSLAGLGNLMCMIDVAFSRRRRSNA